MVWGAFGLAGCAIAASVDYRRWNKMAYWILGGTVLLLVLVFVPHIGWAAKAGGDGTGTVGAHRWIGPSFLPRLPHFQPSELAKLAMILVLAAYGDRYQRQMGTFKQGLAIPIAIVIIPVALIFREPDRGCAILMAAVAGTMLIVAGVRLVYLAPPVLLAAGGLVYSLLHDPMRLRRILAWLHPELSKDGAGYQAYEAMIAFGSGGWIGVGLGNSRQKLGFIPEHHTDFIFAIIGEELGLVATLAVVLIFVIRTLHRAPGGRPVWNAAGGRDYVHDQHPGLHLHGRGRQPAAQQGHAPALYQLWGIEFIVDACLRRPVGERIQVRRGTGGGQTQCLRCFHKVER
jgi:cell division protein FtsW